MPAGEGFNANGDEVVAPEGSDLGGKEVDGESLDLAFRNENVPEPEAEGGLARVWPIPELGEPDPAAG